MSRILVLAWRPCTHHIGRPRGDDWRHFYHGNIGYVRIVKNNNRNTAIFDQNLFSIKASKSISR